MERQLPSFMNHQSAREYFKKIYGKHFVLVDVDTIDGEKIYLYHLVLDEKKYKEGREKLRKGEIIFGTDYLFSYQPIEISEDGTVHIIH